MRNPDLAEIQRLIPKRYCNRCDNKGYWHEPIFEISKTFEQSIMSVSAANCIGTKIVFCGCKYSTQYNDFKK